MFKQFAWRFGIVWMSTLAMLSIFSYLGSTEFYLPSLFHTVFLGFFVSGVALVLFYIASLATWITFNKVKSPGWIVPSLLGIVSGAVAIWLTSMLVPNAIALQSVWSGLAFSFFNTCLIWAITLIVFPKERSTTAWPGS
jgi:hypothetical protein